MILGLIATAGRAHQVLALTSQCTTRHRIEDADHALATAWPLLSLLIWLPILGGALCLLLGNDAPQAARWLALVDGAGDAGR